MNIQSKKLIEKENVVLVSKGTKIVKGVDTGKRAIVVGVVKKLPIKTLNKRDVIPKKIRGVETDVIEVGVIRALNGAPDRLINWRPAPGGVSIGHKDVTAGTLGMVVKKGGVRYILSNNHVIGNENKAKIGDEILQRAKYDGGKVATENIAGFSELVWTHFENGEEPSPPPSDCPIAKIINWLLNQLYRLSGRKSRFPQAVVPHSSMNRVDAALARPHKDEDVLDTILEVGMPGKVIKPEEGMKVKASGRTLGLVYDEVADTDAIAKVQGNSGIAIYEHQCVTKGPMLVGGMSGSVILAENNDVVGLGFAGSDKIALFNWFTDVEEELVLDPRGG